MSNLALRSNSFEGVVYLAYGDESADEKKQRVFAVAVIFGSRSDWSAFKVKWRSRTKGKIFHANECDSDQGTYAKIDHEANKKLYADLSILIAESNLIGRGLAVSIPDYTELVAPVLDENPYYFCFAVTVAGIARLASFCIPRDRVKFTFDRNHEIEYNAAALYDRIINRNDDNEFRKLMDDEIAFATRRTIGIQVADLIAREAMKLIDNSKGPIKRATRKSAKTLHSHGRIRFIQYDRQKCEELVRYATESKNRYLKSDYHDWIQERGLMDTIPSRMRYELFLEIHRASQ